jgi:hypothetical protein
MSGEPEAGGLVKLLRHEGANEGHGPSSAASIPTMAL